jgi:hypothetical protein
MSHSYGPFSNALDPSYNDSYLTEASLECLLVQMHDWFGSGVRITRSFARYPPMIPVSITMSGTRDRVLKFLRDRHMVLESPGADLVGNLIDHIESTPDNAEGFSVSLYANVQYSVPEPRVAREVGP